MSSLVKYTNLVTRGHDMAEDKLSFVAGPYRCDGIRSDRPWGHALEISVHDAASGDLLNTVVFACHPELPGYAALQAMSTDQLIALARAQLECGSLDDSLSRTRGSSLTLLIRFEVPVS